MARGTVPLGDLDGPLSLRATLESGQSYLWEREDGRLYDPDAPTDGWYATTVGEDVVRVRCRDDHLEWHATTDADSVLIDRLGLGDDLPTILATAPDDPVVAAALDAARGLRIVRDPFFPCLVSFICSAQMRVERIHAMQRALRERYGRPVKLAGATHYTFPDPARLAAATEADLRAVGLGYRAPYVRDTARLVADGDLTRDDLPTEYEAVREALTGYVGVGEKVADCVALFSLGFLEAVPLDTWIRTAIAEHFPECDHPTYTETSRAIRERLGGAYAGYIQTYVFDYLRTR